MDRLNELKNAVRGLLPRPQGRRVDTLDLRRLPEELDISIGELFVIRP